MIEFITQSGSRKMFSLGLTVIFSSCPNKLPLNAALYFKWPLSLVKVNLNVKKKKKEKILHESANAKSAQQNQFYKFPHPRAIFIFYKEHYADS